MITSPILHFEFFDRARQFRRAYEILPNIGRPPEWAKYLLFYHAMELALKAYLIQRGVSEKKLASYEFGHDIKSSWMKRSIAGCSAERLPRDDRRLRRAASRLRHCPRKSTDTLST